MPNKKKILITLLSLVVLVGLGVFLANQARQGNLAPEDSNAIYGGQPEAGYPYAGYLIGYQPNDRVNICSVVYIANNYALSAAHCIVTDANVYVGEQDFKTVFADNYPSADVQIKPGWDGKTSTNDLSVIKLGNTTAKTPIYAQIDKPRLGCNYTVVGYGRTEQETTVTSTNRPRKSAQICIDRIETELVYIHGDGGGICFGDSGSPIFETGTNRLVGIVSAIVSTNKDKPPICAIDNTAVALRVDNNTSFINTITGNNNGKILANCGVSCENSECAPGLICTNNKICMLPTRSCLASDNEYCSSTLNIGCSGKLNCVANRCTLDIPAQANNVPTTGLLSGLQSQPLGNNILIIGFTLVVLLILVTVVLTKRKEKQNNK